MAGETATKYSHDNFLQKRDADLGWIRNVMRVAGIGSDVAPNLDRRGLEFAIREWIGEETQGGQLKYYRRNMKRYFERSRQLEHIGRLIGGFVFIMLIVSVLVPSDALRSQLFVVLGLLLLLFGLRQSYAHRVAEKELVKQYEFMYRIFSNARKRLRSAVSDTERRRLLRVLGQAALDEHAEWILRHRERPLDRSGLWRMES